MTVRTDFQLVIRALRAEDWEQYLAMREEASVRYNTLAIPYADPGRFRERVASPGDQEHRLVAEANFPDGTRRMAGMLGLHRDTLARADMASMGIQVATEFQGMGVGTALLAAMCELADGWLNLHRIELDVFTDNERGIALYKKFGFETEATLRRFAFRDGDYVDSYRMGRLNPRHQKANTP